VHRKVSLFQHNRFCFLISLLVHMQKQISSVSVCSSRAPRFFDSCCLVPLSSGLGLTSAVLLSIPDQFISVLPSFGVKFGVHRQGLDFAAA
jgi:hypothetical protein